MMNWKTMFAMLAGAVTWGSPISAKRGGRRPTGAALRNLEDPVQTARFDAAEAKRYRRARTLEENMKRTVANSAHFGFLYEAHDERVYGIPDRLNPFHVAK